MSLIYEPIRLERQEAYLEYLKRCPQKTSDYSFINLWAWSKEYGLCWAWTQDLIWIKQNKPQPVYWAPIGSWRQIDWKTRLSAIGDPRAVFVRMPEYLAKSVDIIIKPLIDPLHLSRGILVYCRIPNWFISFLQGVAARRVKQLK